MSINTCVLQLVNIYVYTIDEVVFIFIGLLVNIFRAEIWKEIENEYARHISIIVCVENKKPNLAEHVAFDEDSEDKKKLCVNWLKSYRSASLSTIESL